MLTLAMGLGFVACDDFDMPNPPAQSNPQEPVFEASNISMTPLTGTDVVDLIQANDGDQLVALAAVTEVKDLPEGYTLEFKGQMSASDAFANPVAFDVVTEDGRLLADPDNLDAAYHSALGTIDPSARETHIRFIAYAVNGTSRIRIGNQDGYFCPMAVQMKPFAPGFVVEEKYYLIGTCSNDRIDKATAIEMHNSGVSPYDDPVFTAVIDITDQQAADGYKWAVVPESTMAAGSGLVMAPSDEALADQMEGYLADSNTLDVFGVVNASNKHLFTVNVKADEDGLYSYKVQLAIPTLYTPGPSNDWNFGKSQQLYTNNYTSYMGFVHIKEQFKFTSAPDWAHTNFGFAEAGKLSTAGSADNLKVNENDQPLTDGLYWCTADIAALTYTALPVSSIGIIGSATEKGWDGEVAMTPSADFMTWTVTTKLKEGAMKFRLNNDWAVSLGGSFAALTTDGGDITVEGADTGDVTITLDLSGITEGVSWYTATITK